MAKIIGKRGELTTKQLVTIIILILSFAVILLLVFRLNLGQTTNAEICRNSVLLKSQSKLGSGSLDCRTNYVCVSSGGECEDFSATSTLEASTKGEIMEALAEEMASCWWQFGEDDKIMYVGGVASAKTFCSICSIVDFDEDIQNEIPSISYDEFYNYLSETQKSQSQTYLQYLYGITTTEDFETQDQVEKALSSDSIFTNLEYSVITGIDANLIDAKLEEKVDFTNVLGDDEWIRAYLIPTSEISNTDCEEFVTKA